jgi:ribonuclease HI
VYAAGAGGAWAAVLTFGRHRREIHGTEPGAPGDRMALTAVVAGLESLTRPTGVEVRVDGDYVRGGGEGELWDRLRAATARHEVSWAWTGEHPELTRARELTASVDAFVEALGEHLENDPDGPDPQVVVDAEELVEDEYVTIASVGAGEITFERIGAVAVPAEIAAQARAGWRILLTAARLDGDWYLLDVAHGEA